MENKRTKGLFSIIRFSPDVYSGEIINIGLILHLEDGKLIYRLIEKDNPKIKTLDYSDQLFYQTFKNKIEYYLSNSEGLVGEVGEVSIASPQNRDFIKIIKNYFSSNNIFFTKPKPLISKNSNESFTNIYIRYMGHFHEKTIEVNLKNEVSKLFEEKRYLGTKVKKNHSIQPIKDLQDLTMKIDFIYKNGVWNYLQVVPNLKNNKNRLDFIAEVQLLFKSINETDKVKFIYNGDDAETKKMIKFLINERKNIERVDLEKKENIDALLLDIEKNAKDNIDDLLAVV